MQSLGLEELIYGTFWTVLTQMLYFLFNLLLCSQNNFKLFYYY